MDIVLQVIINPATHDLSYNPAKEAARQIRGDIINVFSAQEIGTLDGNGDYIPNDIVVSPRCGFIFITSVPTSTIKKIKRRFTESHLDDIDKNIMLLRRKWGLRVSDIPIAVRQQMGTDKYITFTWTKVKNYLRNKAENRTIIDTDITN